MRRIRRLAGESRTGKRPVITAEKQHTIGMKRYGDETIRLGDVYLIGLRRDGKKKLGVREVKRNIIARAPRYQTRVRGRIQQRGLKPFVRRHLVPVAVGNGGRNPQLVDNQIHRVQPYKIEDTSGAGILAAELSCGLQVRGAEWQFAGRGRFREGKTIDYCFV